MQHKDITETIGRAYENTLEREGIIDLVDYIFFLEEEVYGWSQDARSPFKDVAEAADFLREKFAQENDIAAREFEAAQDAFVNAQVRLDNARSKLERSRAA